MAGKNPGAFLALLYLDELVSAPGSNLKIENKDGLFNAEACVHRHCAGVRFLARETQAGMPVLP
jgi:hypothetical protein